MKEVTLKVDGMKCDGCVSSVRSGLEDASGVRNVEVSLDAAEARVATEDDVEAEDLIRAVREAGFEASVAG